MSTILQIQRTSSDRLNKYLSNFEIRTYISLATFVCSVSIVFFTTKTKVNKVKYLCFKALQN